MTAVCIAGDSTSCILAQTEHLSTCWHTVVVKGQITETQGEGLWQGAVAQAARGQP